MGGQAAVDPHLVLPLVLQVFPLPGSSDPEEFHGGPPSRPDLVGIDVALFSPLAILLRFGGHGLHYNPCPQHVRSSPASRVGNIPYDYGGFFRTAPPHTTTVTTIMATAALLRIMGGTRLPKCLRWCMGGVMLLLGIYPRLCTVVGPFPRAMGGIPVRLHWLPQVWCLQAHCFTLLCHRRITVPLLDLTLPCHFPALVEAYLLLSRTITGLG
jgi:hypothetical protein